MSNKKTRLVTYSNPNSIISDQFRTIRTNIRFLANEKEKNVILVTSPGDGEGKSTMIANLAVSIATQKEKVLLIDANLRESVMHSTFFLPNNVGLANVLKGITTLKDAISRTDVENLDVLTSGLEVQNPTELLGSDVMAKLLEAAKAHYNMVLIDAPTILKSTETRVLANQCSGVILVVNRGKTGMEKVVEAKRILKLAHAKLMGVIFNNR
ncbi:CpsD/CapB family tyrosine-protein kinase [Virgibacillus oceani]